MGKENKIYKKGHKATPRFWLLGSREVPSKKPYKKKKQLKGWAALAAKWKKETEKLIKYGIVNAPTEDDDFPTKIYDKNQLDNYVTYAGEWDSVTSD